MAALTKAYKHLTIFATEAAYVPSGQNRDDSRETVQFEG